MRIVSFKIKHATTSELCRDGTKAVTSAKYDDVSLLRLPGNLKFLGHRRIVHTGVVDERQCM